MGRSCKFGRRGWPGRSFQIPNSERSAVPAAREHNCRCGVFSEPIFFSKNPGALLIFTQSLVKAWLMSLWKGSGWMSFAGQV